MLTGFTTLPCVAAGTLTQVGVAGQWALKTRATIQARVGVAQLDPWTMGKKRGKKWVKSGHGEDQNEAGVQHMSIFPGDFCSGFACEKGSLKAWLWWIIRWESWANQALNVCMGVEESCWFTWCEITDPKRMIKFENNIFACNTLTCILSSKSSFKMKITVT